MWDMALSREELDREKAAIIAEIYAAFEGVSREGGISWTESLSIDCPPPTCPPRDEARAMDTDTRWTQLVNDPTWRADMGVGGFNFLDAIGWRYYLPAAMMRELNGGDTWLKHDLDASPSEEHGEPDPWKLEKWSLLDRRQRLCIKRFLEWLIADNEREGIDTGNAGCAITAEWWHRALDSYWSSVE
jgi:hypothetical protein